MHEIETPAKTNGGHAINYSPPRPGRYITCIRHGKINAANKSTIRIVFNRPHTTYRAIGAVDSRHHGFASSCMKSLLTIANDTNKPHAIRRLYSTPAIWGAYPFPEIVVNSLRLGMPSYLVRGFRGELVNKIFRYQITEILAVPGIMRDLVDQCVTDPQRAQIQSLRLVFCAGAPLAPSLKKQSLGLFDTPPLIVQKWGQTECGCLATFSYPESDDTGSVGRPVPGCAIRVSNHNGILNGAGEGELPAKSSHFMTGHMGDELATAETLLPDG